MISLHVSDVMVDTTERTLSKPRTEAVVSNTLTKRQTSTENGKAQPQEVQPAVINEDKLNEEVQRLNEHAQQERRDLHFSVDEQSGRTIIKIIDSQTKEVIRQIPSEEAQILVKRLEEGQGLLLPIKA